MKRRRGFKKLFDDDLAPGQVSPLRTKVDLGIMTAK